MGVVRACQCDNGYMLPLDLYVRMAPSGRNGWATLKSKLLVEGFMFYEVSSGILPGDAAEPGAVNGTEACTETEAGAYAGGKSPLVLRLRTVRSCDQRLNLELSDLGQNEWSVFMCRHVVVTKSGRRQF